MKTFPIGAVFQYTNLGKNLFFKLELGLPFYPSHRKTVFFISNEGDTVIYVTPEQHLSLYNRKPCHTSHKKLSPYRGEQSHLTAKLSWLESFARASACLDKEIPASKSGKDALNLSGAISPSRQARKRCR